MNINKNYYFLLSWLIVIANNVFTVSMAESPESNRQSVLMTSKNIQPVQHHHSLQEHVEKVAAELLNISSALSSSNRAAAASADAARLAALSSKNKSATTSSFDGFAGISSVGIGGGGGAGAQTVAAAAAAVGSSASVHDRIYEFIRLVAESSAANCSENKNVIMPDGIIKQYGFNSFHDQALVAVNRANMLTRLWKYAPELMYKNPMQAQYLLYTSVRSIVEQNEFIYAAGNCYVNTYDGFPGLFAPYAWRKRDDGKVPAVAGAAAPTNQPPTMTTPERGYFDEGENEDGEYTAAGTDQWGASQLAPTTDPALLRRNNATPPIVASIPVTAGAGVATEHIWVKDLSREYSFGWETEWIREPFLKAQDVIQKAEKDDKDYVIKGFNQFRLLHNDSMSEPIEESILRTRYEYGHWSKPYFDCGGGNIWMMTYTVGFFGYDHTHKKYYVKGTSGIDIELQNVDIDQCPSKNLSTVNVFADTARCHKETTQCEHVGGRGFIIGSYVCVCKPGFYYPDAQNPRGFFNGTIIEFEYSKMRRGLPSDYHSLRFKCLPCAEGCETCTSGEPCVIQLDWTLRTLLLVITMLVIGFLPVLVWFTIQLRFLRVVKAASPMLLIIILAGSFLLYGPVIVMYPVPSVFTCTAKFWLREVGFCISYGALLLKTWRIASVFHVRSAQRVRITDMNLIKRLCVIVGAGITICAVRTAVDLPQVEIGRTEDGKKARMCSMGWGDHTLFLCEMMLLLWGIKLCFSVRKAPSEFNESKFISWAIYNETLLSLFLNISMIFLKYPANPDLVYILHFVHSQLTITVVLGLLFGSKTYMISKGQGVAQQQDHSITSVGSQYATNTTSSDLVSITSSGKQLAGGGAAGAQQQQMPKTSGGRRFVTPKIGALALAASAAADTACLLPNQQEQEKLLLGEAPTIHHTTPEIQEELRRLYMQLELLRLRNMRQNNPALSRSIRQMSSAFHYFMNDYLSQNAANSGGSAATNQSAPIIPTATMALVSSVAQLGGIFGGTAAAAASSSNNAGSSKDKQQQQQSTATATATADPGSSTTATQTSSEQSRSYE